MLHGCCGFCCQVHNFIYAMLRNWLIFHIHKKKVTWVVSIHCFVCHTVQWLLVCRCVFQIPHTSHFCSWKRDNQPTSQPTTQSANNLANQPTNEFFSQPASQPTSQPASRPTNQLSSGIRSCIVVLYIPIQMFDVYGLLAEGGEHKNKGTIDTTLDGVVRVLSRNSNCCSEFHF